jgi:hypothetical protein
MEAYRMKRLTFVVAALMMLLSVIPVQAGTGNGAPNGPHYNLNLIAVAPKSALMDDNNGRRIFVPESGPVKIWLSPGDFQVLDANGTDANGASFQLPVPAQSTDPTAPYYCPPTSTTCTVRYSVWVRALGTPGGHAQMYTCFTDATGEYCSDPSWYVESQLVRKTGKSVFENVSKQLLFITVCTAWDSVTGACTAFTHEPLFTQGDQGYFWQYNNYGLKLAQFRFYMGDTLVEWP